MLWRPTTNARELVGADGESLNLPDIVMQRVQEVLAQGYANSTTETYGAGLLVYHVFCDRNNVPDAQRAPCSQDLLLAWISTMAGTYAGTSVGNYVSGLHAWHVIHGIPWTIAKPDLSTIIRGAENLQPNQARLKKRQPYTVEYMEKVLTELDPNDPLDAACAACLTTSFYCLARLGELTVPTLGAFSAASHVSPTHVRRGVRDRNGLECTIIHIPKTKTSQITGEDLYFSEQLGHSNPDARLRHHLSLNKPSDSEHLFAYTHTATGKRPLRRPLTKSAFLKRIHTAARRQHLEPLQGHGIRIGATLEYLLRGVSFEAVKVLGRWKSDAFLRYLRKHAEIMTPYLQPHIHQDLIRYTLPSA